MTSVAGRLDGKTVAALVAVPAAFLGLFFWYPVAALLWRGAVDPLLGDTGNVLLTARTWRVVATSLALALAGAAGSVVVGVPAAWALYRARWRGQAIARALVTVPFVLPTVVVAAAFTALLRPSGWLGWLSNLGLGPADQSWGGIVAALVFFNVAVVVHVVGAAWSSLPARVEHAARTLGARPWRVWWSVTLPSLRGPIASAAAVAFLFCSTAFALVLVLGGTRVNTVETEIWIQVNQFLDLRAASALALIQVAFVGAALALNAWARRGAGSSDGRDESVDGRGLTVVACLAPAALLIGLPLGALVERALRTPTGWGLDNIVALATQPAAAVLPEPVWMAAARSLGYAAVAATVAVAIGAALAVAIARSRRGTWIDALSMAPLGVSSVVVGLGALLALRQPILGIDLAATGVLVPAAQAVVATPLVVRALVPAVRAVDGRLRAAAATLGAAPAAVWRHVDLPALLRPLAVAGGLAFAVCVGEFGATTFVASPADPTLPTAIFRLLGRPGAENVGMAHAAALLLALIAAGATLAGERWRGSGRVGL